LCHLPNCFRDGFPFVKDFVVPIPQDAEALRLQPLIAHSVVLAIPFCVMLATIQFDDHPFFEADEVDNVLSQRKLTAEFHPLESAAAKLAPETCLRFGWKAPKLPRAVSIASQGPEPPHP
jgi:hypothetical protein